MTALTDILLQRIAQAGPMTVADYMSECLLHPEHGYYPTRDPFGKGGDFTTAPEITQMFGELLGLALAQAWMDQGSPAEFALAEIGPGRGTLMSDAIRVTARVPGFHDAMRLHLVEVSATLRLKQRETLDRDDITWHDSTATLPALPLFLIANEFFDALPIRQFQRDEKGWRERQVGAVAGRLVLGLSTPAPLALLDPRLDDTKPGDVVEVRASATRIIQDLANRIATHGGVALIVDYGNWHSLGDTLQALKDHAPDDPLAHPGQADLTAHVDFEALAHAATGVAVTPMIPQGELLQRLGISVRAQTLAASLKDEALASHLAAYRRLTAPSEMGTLFQAMALYPLGAALPAGFEE